MHLTNLRLGFRQGSIASDVCILSPRKINLKRISEKKIDRIPLKDAFYQRKRREKIIERIFVFEL